MSHMQKKGFVKIKIGKANLENTKKSEIIVIRREN